MIDASRESYVQQQEQQRQQFFCSTYSSERYADEDWTPAVCAVCVAAFPRVDGHV